MVFPTTEARHKCTGGSPEGLLVGAFHAIALLEGSHLGPITGGAQIGTVGAHHIELTEMTIGRSGTKQRILAQGHTPLRTTRRAAWRAGRPWRKRRREKLITSNMPAKRQSPVMRCARAASRVSRNMLVPLSAACGIWPKPPVTRAGVWRYAVWCLLPPGGAPDATPGGYRVCTGTHGLLASDGRLVAASGSTDRRPDPDVCALRHAPARPGPLSALGSSPLLHHRGTTSLVRQTRSWTQHPSRC